MERVLEVEGLAKRFDKRALLQGLTFTLYKGESVVLAGPNGCGKSTLLRMIAGLLRPDEGSVRMIGEEKGSRKWLSASSAFIGYVPERMPYLRFTPEEYLRHMGSVRGIGRASLDKRVDQLLDFCRLDKARHTPIRHFSKGMLQKVGIMQAILNEPRLLLMDEPFSGLDVASQEELVQLLLRLRSGGMTLLFASHEPELAERLASRMIVLGSDGRYEDKPIEGKPNNRMVVCAAALDDAAMQRIVKEFGGLVHVSEGAEVCFFAEEGLSDHLLLRIIESGGSIRGVQLEREVRAGWIELLKRTGKNSMIGEGEE